jgi:hypothetical protein
LTYLAEAVLAKEITTSNPPRFLGIRHTCCMPKTFTPGTIHGMYGSDWRVSLKKFCGKINVISHIQILTFQKIWQIHIHAT